MKNKKKKRFLAGVLAGLFLLTFFAESAEIVRAAVSREEHKRNNGDAVRSESTGESIRITGDSQELLENLQGEGETEELLLSSLDAEDTASETQIWENTEKQTVRSDELLEIGSLASPDEPVITPDDPYGKDQEQISMTKKAGTEEAQNISSALEMNGVAGVSGNTEETNLPTSQTDSDDRICLAEAAKTVTITFCANGGSGTKAAQEVPAQTAAVLQANDPEQGNGFQMKGCLFAGWNTKRDGSGTSVPDGGALLAEKDMTLYAMWVQDASACTIVYHANGGQGEDIAKTYLPEGGCLEKELFTREYYTFAGWNTRASGTGTQLSEGAALSKVFRLKKSSLQLYAQWKPMQFTICYELGGGKNSASNPAGYSYGQIVRPVAPSRQGYLFAGWYEDSSFSSKVEKITKGNVVLYAKWKPITYQICFSANGGSGTTKSMKSCAYDSTYTLTANAFQRSGYAFAGWNLDPNGKGKALKNKASVKNLLAVNGGTVTLYAQWNRIYKISYECNGGKLPVSAVKTFTVASKTFDLPAAVRTGYTFQGWYLEKSLKTKVTSVEKGSTGNRTCYAKWKANTYRVKYRGNGSSSGNMSSWQNKKYTYGKSFTLPGNGYKRTDYTFTGWNTRADGSGISYKNKASVKNLTAKNGGVVTLYAQWKQNKTLVPLRTEEGYRAGNISGSYAGGAFSSNGCGPAACAIISGAHPLSVGAWMTANGEVGYGGNGQGGTNPTGITRYFQAHGISVGRPGNYQEWYQLMATGNYYGICLMTAASPYTNGAHYIVISDVSSVYGCHVYDATWSGRDGWSGLRFGVLSFDGMSSAWWVIPKYR